MEVVVGNKFYRISCASSIEAEAGSWKAWERLCFAAAEFLGIEIEVSWVSACPACEQVGDVFNEVSESFGGAGRADGIDFESSRKFLNLFDLVLNIESL